MIAGLDYFRELNPASVALRLALAMFCGGMIGLERTRKHRPAGFRTYMLVCMGTALTGILSQYLYTMLRTDWSAVSELLNKTIDVSRIGAKAIGGIGFLGAGTILSTDRQRVKGLTTAAGLWSSACMGLAVGAGFYECVVLALLLIFLVVHLLLPMELYVLENARNMNIYVEFQSLDNVAEILSRVKAQDVTVYEVEVDHGKQTMSGHPNAQIAIRMNQKGSHAKILTAISELESVYVVHDL